MADFLTNGINLSGTIAAAATSQALAADNETRRYLFIQNISAADLWVNPFGAAAAVDGVGSFKIAPGAAFTVPTNDAVAIVGGTLGQKFSAIGF